MFNPELLEQAFANLIEQQSYGSCETEEMEDIFNGMDYEALANTLWNKLQTVYVYKTDGKYVKSFDYRSQELFLQRASLIYSELSSISSDIVNVSYCQELWLLEDYSFAVVNSVALNIPDPQFQYDTEFRTLKSIGKDCKLLFDIEEMGVAISSLCDDYFEQEIPCHEY